MTTEKENIDIEDEVAFLQKKFLTDYLIVILPVLGYQNLKLFKDGNMNGKEYPTGFGLIDILTTDEKGNFNVFETHTHNGADKALEQLVKKMEWVKSRLAKNKEVFGTLVTAKIDDEIQSTVEATPNVALITCNLNFTLHVLVNGPMFSKK